MKNEGEIFWISMSSLGSVHLISGVAHFSEVMTRLVCKACLSALHGGGQAMSLTRNKSWRINTAIMEDTLNTWAEFPLRFCSQGPLDFKT